MLRRSSCQDSSARLRDATISWLPSSVTRGSMASSVIATFFSINQLERPHVRCFLHHHVVSEGYVKDGISCLLLQVDVHCQHVRLLFRHLCKTIRLRVVRSCPPVACPAVLQSRMGELHSEALPRSVMSISGAPCRSRLFSKNFATSAALSLGSPFLSA